MRLVSLLLLCGSLLLAGCTGDTSGAASNGSETDPALADRSTPADEAETGEADLRVVPLTPENTTIQFVATHVTEEGPDPNPRTGVFTEFAGQAKVDPATNSLQSVSVEIQTRSLQTPIEKLNNHLRSPDFFDAREYPTARFVSTEITPASGGEATHTIAGKLTLLDTSKEISFPATVRVNDGEVLVDSKFTLDRAEFGMDKLQDRVNKEVELTIAVGKKTELPQAGG